MARALVIALFAAVLGAAEDAAAARAALLARLAAPGPLIIGQNSGVVDAADAGYRAAFSGDPAPLLCGVDYGWDRIDPAAIRVANAVLIQHARRGGLVTISLHPGNPATGGSVRDTAIDLDAVLTPGTPAHTRWQADLALVADGLAELRDAGAPVLWRPLHEANGRWFWWGQGTPEQFRRLWADLHAMFTRRGLNHLVWVYAANARTAADVAPPAERYPGAALVDVVALDRYADDHAAAWDDVPALVALGKPFALGEIGPVRDRGGFDAVALRRAIATHAPQARWCLWWHSWSEGWRGRQRMALADNPGADALLGRDDVAVLRRP